MMEKYKTIGALVVSVAMLGGCTPKNEGLQKVLNNPVGGVLVEKPRKDDESKRTLAEDVRKSLGNFGEKFLDEVNYGQRGAIGASFFPKYFDRGILSIGVFDIENNTGVVYLNSYPSLERMSVSSYEVEIVSETKCLKVFPNETGCQTSETIMSIGDIHERDVAYSKDTDFLYDTALEGLSKHVDGEKIEVHPKFWQTYDRVFKEAKKDGK